MMTMDATLTREENKIKVKVGMIFHLAISNVTEIHSQSKSSSDLKLIYVSHIQLKSHSLRVSRKREYICHYDVRFNFEVIRSFDLHSTAFTYTQKLINKQLIREFRLRQTELDPDNFAVKSLKVSE